MHPFDRASLEALFFLGHEPGDPTRPIIYPKEASQRPHLAYYGTTRSGKSYAVEYALQQLVRHRRAGFCLIDPHAEVYWRTASYLRQHGITERVLFWDVNDDEYVVTFDPFGLPNAPPSYIAGNLTDVLLATLGTEKSPEEQPQLKPVTFDGVIALIQLALPFALSHILFDPSDVAVKSRVADRLQALGESNQMTRIAQYKPDDRRRDDLLMPTYRRVHELFQEDRFRLSFAAPGVDFRQLMDEGWIVLVNVEPRKQYRAASAIFTRLLIKQFFQAATTRDPSSDPSPFFLVVDEAPRYLTRDTAAILDQTAKYRLYAILLMQGLEQARQESLETYTAIRENVNGEVVMRLRDFDEKMYFARRFYGDYFDFTTIKHENVQTIAIPRIVEDTTSGYSEPSGPTVTTDHQGRETTTQPAGTRTTSTVFRTDYEYQEIRTPVFYTPDELERLHAARFGRRPPGAGQRLGVASMNEDPPTEIEIPQLARPMYSPEEMHTWLRTFKSTQPSTLPLIEARQRFDALVSHHLQLLTHAEPRTTSPRKSPQPSQRLNPNLDPAVRKKKKPSKGTGGEEGQTGPDKSQRRRRR